MTDEPDNETIRKVMQELGRRGGEKSTTAKRKASKKSLEKARKARWPGRPKKGKGESEWQDIKKELLS